MSDFNILEMKGITKQFPGVLALNNVCFNCHRGEIHALIGENGAGKSTLIKLLSGSSFPTEGSILFDGKEWSAKTPHQALQSGIAIIYQELNLVGELDAVENIFLGREIKRGIFTDYAKMKKKATEIIKSMDMEINMSVPVNLLSIAQQQMVEIAKALSRNAKFIIMDEPTATLTSHEVGNLFRIMRQLKEKGVTVVFISHHLSEIFDTCDRMTILKDGELVGCYNVCDITEKEIIRLMVGREVTEIYPPKPNAFGDVLLKIEAYTNEKIKEVNLELCRGEILGIAGLVGAGRTELARAIFGADRKTGKTYLDGKQISISKPKDAIKFGIALLTEDRKQQGLVLGLTVKENISLPILKQISRGGLINLKKEREIVNGFINSLRIATPNMEMRAVNLSGGNQQKVVLAKWLAADCDVLILDEPTRGIDVGAKIEIYNLMRQLCEKGKAIVMISSELPEVIGMSDRILVMRDGVKQAEIQGTNISEEIILQNAMG